MGKRNRQLLLWSFPRALNAKRFKAGDGRDLRLYTIPALALMTGKAPRQVWVYERCGVIPPTPYVVQNARKVRYYTFDQMRVVRETLHDIPLRGNHEKIRRRIELGWVISGVPMEPGLNFASALLLSAGSADCEPVEKEFLLRALEAEKGKTNGQAESGVVDGTWRYLKDESGKAPYKNKSKRALGRQFNALCSGETKGEAKIETEGEAVGSGLAGVTGRNGSDRESGEGDESQPLYSDTGSRLWRRPRPRGVCGDSVD